MNEVDLLALQDTIDRVTFKVAEFERKLSNLVRPGVVKSYDAKNATAVLDLGFETHDVPVGCHAGTGKDWRPFKKGQQITALCPDGDIANAFLLPGGFHDDNPAPSQSADEDIRAQRGDGDKAVRLRTTDDAAELDNKAHKTVARAGKDAAELVHIKKNTAVRAKEKVAELDNPDGKSAVRAKENGIVQCVVEDVTKFKIVIQGQAFYVRPEALLPTDL